MADKLECPKCGWQTGADWEQCHGLCPMPMSPHYTRPTANAPEPTNLQKTQIAPANAPGVELAEKLRAAADEMRAEGQNGWPVLCDHVADYLAALQPTTQEGLAVLKGAGKINGDGWKDTTRIGEVVFVWNTEKPSPYSPGQYPRIGCEGWSASTNQYDFTPATADDLPVILTALRRTPDEGVVEALQDVRVKVESRVRDGVTDYNVAFDNGLRAALAIIDQALTSLGSNVPTGEVCD